VVAGGVLIPVYIRVLALLGINTLTFVFYLQAGIATVAPELQEKVTDRWF